MPERTGPLEAHFRTILEDKICLSFLVPSAQQYRKGFKTRTNKYVRVTRTSGTSSSRSLPTRNTVIHYRYINRAVQAAERQFLLEEELSIAGRGVSPQGYTYSPSSERRDRK
jgi:hypothetical protein